MILDLLANHTWYLPLHPRLQPAFAWLLAQDWGAVADGRQAIDGENIFAITESGQTAAPAARRCESHRRYLDIQYVIAGGERMGWCPAAGAQPGVEEKPDLLFHPEPPDLAFIRVLPGQFAIFLPLEVHKPLCHLGGAAAAFRKCVVKVAWA